MSASDQRPHKLFHHVRAAVDLLEQILLSDRLPQGNEKPQVARNDRPTIKATEKPHSDRLAYTLKEVQKLVGISRSGIYLPWRRRFACSQIWQTDDDTGERPSGVARKAACKILAGGDRQPLGDNAGPPNCARIRGSMLPRLLPRQIFSTNGRLKKSCKILKRLATRQDSNLRPSA